MLEMENWINVIYFCLSVQPQKSCILHLKVTRAVSAETLYPLLADLLHIVLVYCVMLFINDNFNLLKTAEVKDFLQKYRIK